MEYKVTEVVFAQPTGHTIDHCDRCERLAGFSNLYPASFIFKNWNDWRHSPDAKGYITFYLCKECRR